MPDYFCDRFHPVQCSKTCFIHNYFRKLQFKWNLRLILCFNTQNSFLASKPHEKHLSSEIQNKEANIQILGQHVQGSKTWHFGFKWKTPLIWLWKMRVNFFFRDTHSLNNTQNTYVDTHTHTHTHTLSIKSQNTLIFFWAERLHAWVAMASLSCQVHSTNLLNSKNVNSRRKRLISCSAQPTQNNIKV